jgi:uracil phosphoribosyltransferase
VTLLRDVSTERKLFRELVDELAMLMAYEVMASLELRERRVETPLEETTGWEIDADRLVLVPILRAGLGMVEGMRRVVPTMNVGHIGLQREHDTLEPVDYYFNIPPEPEERTFVVVDPMLATGGTATAAVEYLKDSGAGEIAFVCIVAAPEGLGRLGREHGDVSVFTAAVDRELDENGYILPGLGDAGDRLYGT